MQRVPSNNITMRGTLGGRKDAAGGSQGSNQADKNSTQEVSSSPVALMARRIREEQGADQLSAFFKAMQPFAAPNELKRIGRSFGIDYESIAKAEEERKSGQQIGQHTGPQNRQLEYTQNAQAQVMQTQPERQQQASYQQQQFAAMPIMPQQMQGQTSAQPPQLQMLQTLMTLQNLMGGGRKDPTQLMHAFGGFNQGR